MLTSCLSYFFLPKVALLDAINNFLTASFMAATVVATNFFLLKANVLTISEVASFCLLSLFFMHLFKLLGSSSYYFIS